jgi:antitoxin MazE
VPARESVASKPLILQNKYLTCGHASGSGEAGLQQENFRHSSWARVRSDRVESHSCQPHFTDIHCGDIEKGKRAMRTEFVKWGNSLALRVPSAFAKEVGATKGKQAEMTIEGGALVVKVVERPKKRRRYTLDELLADFDPDAHRADVNAWDRAPPVGREII